MFNEKTCVRSSSICAYNEYLRQSVTHDARAMRPAVRFLVCELTAYYHEHRIFF